jgi:hypothetical protein
MNALRFLKTSVCLGFLALPCAPLPAASETPAAAADAGAKHDGQHDFDFEIGTWKAHISRLQHPLTGSTTWVEMEGVVVVRKVWNGRANLMQLEVDSPTGHLEELNLRLYNPQSHQWSFNFSNSKDGTMAQPMIGEFKNGRGEFFDQEPLMAEPSLSALLSQISKLTRAALNNHSRMMGAKRGR